MGDLSKFQPMQDRVLVRRIRKEQGLISTVAHDENATNGMILTEGEVLTAGPEATVKAGQKVIFNARWNDFSVGEFKGTDCDMKGPLARPVPIEVPRDLHLITEGDIAGVIEVS